MEDLAGSPHLRPATEDDEQFLYDVFTTTWADEVAALPNPNLAAHVLRIQHTAQERRFEARYADFERFVIMHEGRRAGRLYVQRTPSMVHAIDMTLLPQFRSQGIGTRIVSDLLAMAARNRQDVTLRVPRRNSRAVALYEATGFRLVTVDDLDCYFEWSPALSGGPEAMAPAARDHAR